MNEPTQTENNAPVPAKAKPLTLLVEDRKLREPKSTATDLPPMDPADRALVQSYVEKYVNTGTEPTPEDRVKMLELVKKYNIKVNTNPRPIVSRFARAIPNKASANGTAIPRRAPVKIMSKAAIRKQKAEERRQSNRDRHSA